MSASQAPPRDARERFQARIGAGISFSRILLMFFIVAGHAALIADWYGHYCAGLTYPYTDDAFPAFLAALAAQPSLADRIFLVYVYNFWSLNFAFYALSGFSLWFSLMRKGVFDLRDYFFSRFFGVYLGFFAAALAAFVVAVGVMGHVPGEHDLNYMLLGAVRARETMPYNDTLWFLSGLFILYLLFPLLPALYARTGYPGLAALFAGLCYAVYAKGYLARYTFLPTAAYFFVLGVFAAATLHVLARRLAPKGGGALKISPGPLILAGLGLVLAFALYRLYALTYADLLAAGRLGKDTHAIGLFSFLAFLLAGTLIPWGARTGRVLRLVSRGTFAVYVYHYLFMKLYGNHAGFKAFTLSVLPSSGFLTEHLLAGSLALYGLFLAAGLVYQLAFDAVTGAARRYYGKPIVLRERN